MLFSKQNKFKINENFQAVTKIEPVNTSTNPPVSIPPHLQSNLSSSSGYVSVQPPYIYTEPVNTSTNPPVDVIPKYIDYGAAALKPLNNYNYIKSPVSIPPYLQSNLSSTPGYVSVPPYIYKEQQKKKKIQKEIPKPKSTQPSNDFYIKNKDSDKTIMELDNVEDYYLENDPVVIGKKFKLLKLLNNSQIRIYRENVDSEKDFTFGFYFRTFKTQLPTVFSEFMILSNNESTFELKANLDLKTNKIIFNFSTNDVANTIQLSFNNAKILNYVVIQIKNNVQNNVPMIIFNLNNQITSFKFLTNKKIKIHNIEFKNFEGYLGKVLIYNSIVSNDVLCRKFNCNLSCFRPDGSKTYGGDVNKCIKDCMKSCNDISKCQKICVDCEIEEEEWDTETKIKMCPWLKDIKTLDKSTPNAPKIRGFPGDGKILVEWKKPFNGKSIINNYIIMVYETFNKKNGVQINISSNPTCELCEHEIKNLKNQVYYDIIVKAVNNVGIGPSSNIITIAPNGEKLKNDLNNIFYELDDDLENSISVDDVDIACDSKGYYNVQNHMLDNDIPNLENIIRKQSKK